MSKFNPEYIARAVTEGVARWGSKNYGTGEFHPDEVVEALAVIYHKYAQMPTLDDVEDMQTELKKLRKDLALSKAREAKARKRNAEEDDG